MSLGSTIGMFAPAVRMLVVGISDAKASGDQDSVLVTYALGSCIGVCMFDPVAKVAGLLHIMLPESALDPEKAQANPYMFADTGVPGLIAQMLAKGALKRRITVRLAGGAQVVEGRDVFNIGKRNYTAIRKILWKEGLLVDGEMVGGEVSRTVRLEVTTGRVLIREAGARDLEIPLKGVRYGR
jgi:chemotaxis protein CheD